MKSRYNLVEISECTMLMKENKNDLQKEIEAKDERVMQHCSRCSPFPNSALPEMMTKEDELQNDIVTVRWKLPALAMSG